MTAQVIRAELIGCVRLVLHIGGRSTGITVERDPGRPSMWRVHRTGQASDIVNLTRAKDAAVAWARPRGLGGGEVVHWHRRERGAGASHIAQNNLDDQRPPEAA
jgi:hypothetical protein